MSDLEARPRSAPVARLGPADFGAWVEPHLAVMDERIAADVDAVVVETLVVRLGP